MTNEKASMEDGSRLARVDDTGIRINAPGIDEWFNLYGIQPSDSHRLHAFNMNLNRAHAEKVRPLVEALEAVEFVDFEYDGKCESICAWCGGSESTGEGHKPDCLRQKALAARIEKGEVVV